MAPTSPNTVYTKTEKGLLEIRNKTVKLPRDAGLVFLSIDGKATVGDLLPRSGMSAAQFHQTLDTLVADGYIRLLATPVAGAARQNGESLDFTPTQALSKLTAEAASHAAREGDATRRAREEAQAALEARLLEEAESRARSLAEARAQTEQEARMKAQAAALSALEEQMRAQGEAGAAASAAERADAEARAKAARALVVRAEAEARARAEGAQRARAFADSKRAAEQQARDEAEARAHAEAAAKAEAEAESRARQALEAQLQVMSSGGTPPKDAEERLIVSKEGDDPKTPSQVPPQPPRVERRARERTLGPLHVMQDAEAQRARELAELARAATTAAKPKIIPDIDISERARELTARVQAGHRAREESNRKARDALLLEAEATPPGSKPSADAFPALDLADRGVSPKTPEPVREQDNDLPRVDIAALTAPEIASEHMLTALERAMAEQAVLAQAQQAQARSEAAPAAKPAEPPVTQESAPAPDAGERTPAGANIPALEVEEPVHEKLNVDRAAHDVLAETAESRRKAEMVATSRVDQAAREAQAREEARRAAAELREARRKQVVRGVAFAIVGVPVLAVLWLQFVPLNGYLPAAQQALSARLNQPVTISSLHYVLLPTPRIVLDGVKVGAEQGVRVDRVEAHAMPFAVMGEPKRFDTVEIRNVTIEPAIVSTIPSWSGGRSASAMHVSRLQIANLKLNVPGADFPGLDGDILFEPNGTVKQAVLTNEKMKVQLSPQADGIRMTVDGSALTLPFGPPVEFSFLKATGLLGPDHLAVNEFSSRIAGGEIRATGTARWSGPLTIDGTFTVQNARLQELLPVFTTDFSAKGSLRANGRYTMQADKAEALLPSTRVDGTFAATHGELTNIDILRGIQSPGNNVFRGGRTPFDELTGSFQTSANHYAYRQIQLSSGPLNANGTVEVAPGGQLSGRLDAELAPGTRVVARSSFSVAGTLKDPVLRR